MAVTEVGTPAAPAVSSGTNSPSVGPATTPALNWSGTQTRTAGNYLLCVVTNWGGTTGGTPGTPSGWTQLLTITSNARSVVTYFGKVAAGSDTAPVVSATNTGTATFSTLSAMLHEMTGQDASLPTPVAVSGTAVGTTVNPLVVTTSDKVPVSGCFAFGAAVLTIAGTTASTLGAGSGWTNIGDNAASVTRAHFIHTTQSNPTSAATLSESFSYTGTGSFLAGAVLVILPPGCMTVTATPNGSATAASAKIVVITSATESGGAGINGGGGGTGSLTPNGNSSLPVWVAQDFFGPNAFTAIGSNPILNQFAASAAQVANGSYNGTTAAGTPITVGATSADGGSSAVLAAYEVLASGGTPAIDGSTPTNKAGNSSAALVTTPFQPPAGAVLAMLFSSYNNPASPTVTDSLGLTWTRRDGGSTGNVAVYTATVTSGTSGSATLSGTGTLAAPGEKIGYSATLSGSGTLGGAGGNRAIAAAAFGTGSTSSSTTTSAPAPAGVALGDLLLIFMINATSTVTFSVTAGSTGWTAVGPSTGQNITGTLFYKTADSTDVSLSGSSGSYTITSSAGHSAEGMIILAPNGGFDPATPSNAGQYATTATTSSFSASGVTTTNNGDTIMVFGAVRAPSGTPSTMTLPAGFSALVAQSNTTAGANANVGLILGTKSQTTAGATGSQAVTSGAVTNGGAFLFALTGSGVTPPAGTVLQLVAGAPDSGSFQVVAKTTGATSVRLAYSVNSDMSSPSFVSAQTPDAMGYMRWTASSLSAHTQYYYQLMDTPSGGMETAIGGIGQSRTLPSAGSAQSFTVALVSCIAEQDSTAPPALDVAMADWNSYSADLNIFTGDFNYSGTTSTTLATQVGIFETQIALYPELANMVSQNWGYYCRSDHEAGPDNGDSNNSYTATNIAAAQQVFPFGTLGDTVNTPVHGLYQAWVVGRVRFIMIDIRNTDRSPGGNTDNGSKTMLGATQLAWLESQLIQSEPLKVIISDVAWMGTPTIVSGPDKWWSYDTERQAILAYIAANAAQVKGLMLWHGDTHLVGCTPGTANAYGGFPVYCAAPLLNIGGGLMQGTFTQKYNNGGAGECRQYGRISFTDTGSKITVDFQGWDAVNAVAQVEQIDTFETTGTLSGSGTLAAATTLPGAAALSGTGTLSGAETIGRQAVLSGTGTLAATEVQAGAATLSGTGTLSGAPVRPATATLSGTGTLSASPVFAATATLSGTGTLSGAPIRVGAATLSGTGTLSAAGVKGFAGAAALSGTGTLTAAEKIGWLATLSGTGTLTGTQTAATTATLTGTGTLGGASTVGIGATLSGLGTLLASLTLLNNAEGGTNGTTVTTGNSGGASGNAFDVISMGAGTTLAFDNAQIMHGALAYKVATGSTVTTALEEWTSSGGTQTTIFYRIYCYVPPGELATAAWRPFAARATGGHAGSLLFQTNGTVQLSIGTGFSAVQTFGTPCPIGQWFRVEGYILGDASVGAIMGALFLTPDGRVPVEVKTSVGQNTTGVLNNYFFGQNNSSANSGPFWFDDIGISPLGFLGPVGDVAGISLQNSAEGGTNGTTVTAPLSGNKYAGNQFDAVNIGALATLTFDNAEAAHGNLSYKMTTGSPAANAIVEWTNALTGPVPVPQVWWRMYLFITGFSATQNRVASLRNGATYQGGPALNSTGKVVLLNSTGGTLKTSTTSVPLNQWFRLEGYVLGDPSVGAVEVKIFATDPESSTPDEVVTATGANTGGLINRIDFGNPSSVASYTFWMDELGSSTQGYMGPAGYQWAITGSGTLSVSSEIVGPFATLSGSGTLAATEVQAGAATLSGSGTLSASPVRPATATLSGTGTLAGTSFRPATATLSGTGTLSATDTTSTTATMSGSGTLAATYSAGGAGLSGTGTLAVSGETVTTAAALSGSGTLSTAPAFAGTSGMSGTGTLSASPLRAGAATLSGSGTLAALWKMGQQSAMSGLGTLLASPSFPRTSAMSGSGTLSAVQSAAVVPGSGDTSVFPFAVGTTSVTRTTVSAGNVTPATVGATVVTRG